MQAHPGVGPGKGGRSYINYIEFIILKQGQTVHKLQIYIHTFVPFVCDVCLMCADLPTASKVANGYGDETK